MDLYEEFNRVPRELLGHELERLAKLGLTEKVTYTVADVTAFLNDIQRIIEEQEGGGSAVDNPAHYTAGKVETIDKIEAVVEGLPAAQAVALANVIKYVDRAGLKGDADEDLAKANNYAHRLVFGDWRSVWAG